MTTHNMPNKQFNNDVDEEHSPSFLQQNQQRTNYNNNGGERKYIPCYEFKANLAEPSKVVLKIVDFNAKLYLHVNKQYGDQHISLVEREVIAILENGQHILKKFDEGNKKVKAIKGFVNDNEPQSPAVVFSLGAEKNSKKRKQQTGAKTATSTRHVIKKQIREEQHILDADYEEDEEADQGDDDYDNASLPPKKKTKKTGKPKRRQTQQMSDDEDQEEDELDAEEEDEDDDEEEDDDYEEEAPQPKKRASKKTKLTTPTSSTKGKKANAKGPSTKASFEVFNIAQANNARKQSKSGSGVPPQDKPIIV